MSNYVVSEAANIQLPTNADLRRLNNLRGSLMEAIRIGRRCGVYRLSCRTSGESYVGASRNIYRRAIQHRSNAKNSEGKMRDVFRSNGAGGFDLEVLEFCDPKQLLSREAHWISALGPSLNSIRPRPDRTTNKNKPVVTLGAGVAGTNFIQRFCAGAELPPIYVAPASARINEALTFARREAIHAGYKRFFFQGMTYSVETTDIVPESLDVSAR